MVIISFTTAYPVVQGTSWLLPGTGNSTTHSLWRSWCLIIPRLYVVPLLYAPCAHSLIINIDYYRHLQWQVSTSSRDQQDISPLNALGLSASWGDEGVDVSADPAVWIVREADNGYTYVTSTSFPHLSSSFALVVLRMAVVLLSGVWQARR